MKKIIFLHHQRTGGSSFRHYFRHSVYSFTYREYRKDLLLSEFDDINQKVIELEPGIFLPELQDKAIFFTILRDPVERVISFLNLYYIKDNMNDADWNYLNSKLNTSEDYNTHNTYTKSFLGSTFNDALINASNCDIMIFDKNNVVRNITFLQYYYGLNSQNMEYPHLMKSSNDIVFPDYVIETIKQNNKYDIELFNYFNEKKDEHNFIRKMER